MSHTIDGRETELKFELHGATPNEQLQETCGPPIRKTEQLNRYFHPKGPRETMVRVREEAGAQVLTVKGPTTIKSGGLFVRAEDNATIPPEWLFSLQAGETPDDLKQHLEKLGVEPPLRYVGALRNTRWVFEIDGLKLELDCTHYPGGQPEWEVELETEQPETDGPKLKKLLDDSGIPHQPSTQSKYQKFLASIGSR